MARLKRSVLKEQAQRVDATQYLDVRDYLEALYNAVKKEKEFDSYSYLAFAADLGFGRTNVIHLVIRGKRPLGNRSAEKISTALSLAGTQKNYFTCLAAYQNARDPIERETLFRQLLALKQRTISSDEKKSALAFFSEWYHIAIYEMVAMRGFSSDPAWISTHLTPRIRPEMARRSFELLNSLGLIRKKDDKDIYEQTQRRISTGDEIASLAVVRYHQKMIEMGRESITTISEEDRDISAITIALPQEKLMLFKEAVSEFRKKMLGLAEECTDKNQVYQMNIQLFPLSKANKEKDSGT